MRALLPALSALLLAGCETVAYYGQAAGGQLALMGRARPLEAVRADPATGEALKARLALAAEMRDFASRELALPEGGAYRSYADLGRPYALWNVVAAPEFSLAPLVSCFPVAGCVSYRGYYDREAAERHAHGLRAAGHDVVVYGVPAYSTLGWFDDPLLSTFIGYAEVDLARLMFHELAHQQLYVKDDTAFNESFAVAVEREGLRRWLTAKGRAAELKQVREREARVRELHAQIGAARERLAALYRSGLASEALREKKRAEMDGLRPLLAQFPGFAGQAPNNAVLASLATYADLVPAFERLLADAGGDLPAFYARVSALAALPLQERKAALASPPSAPSSPGPSSAPRR
ncbi:MAG TPA: aminopeptidase [Burkholderiales bacterium]